MAAAMNQKMIEVLKQFFDYRDKMATIDRFAPYNWCESPSGLSLLIPYSLMLDEHSRELANSINEFLRYISNIEACKFVIDSLEGDVKLEIIVELVAPFTTLAINMPYVIRNRFIYFISHLCHQANLAKVDKWIDNLPLETEIAFNVADKYCSVWKGYNNFKKALEKINDKKYREVTKDFRNKYNHRYSLSIELGLTEFVKRVVKEDGKVIYGLGYTKPLKLDQLLPALKKQHANCLDAFAKYQTLIHEQISALDSWSKLEKEA